MDVAGNPRGIAAPLGAGIFIGLSALLFAVAIALAVRHRYLSSEGMFYHIKALRLFETKQVDDAASYATKRTEIYIESEWWLNRSAVLFLAGGGAFVIGFSILLLRWVL